MSHYSKEVSTGVRFKFGANWLNFLRVINNERIQQAEQSLKNMLFVDDLSGKRFLDAGSGSGIISLAARRLGASVYSFDYDTQSVACTQELKRRYFPDDPHWYVQTGSVLDAEYLKTLGQFDVVYSWGVLHHTGAMWHALGEIGHMVVGNGQLFIAIYNDEGLKSRYWIKVKKAYTRYPLLRWLLVLFHIPYPFLPSLLYRMFSGSVKETRGMSLWYDLIDWIGGFPFEVAKPEEIISFYQSLGFQLKNLRTTNRSGCNQYIFVKERQN